MTHKGIKSGTNGVWAAHNEHSETEREDIETEEKKHGNTDLTYSVIALSTSCDCATLSMFQVTFSLEKG